MCYGEGLAYDTERDTAQVKQKVADFSHDKDLMTYLFRVSHDFKHFGFCVTVIILNKEGSKRAHHQRKEARYCRLDPADVAVHIPYIFYANCQLVTNAMTYNGYFAYQNPWFCCLKRPILQAEIGIIAIRA